MNIVTQCIPCLFKHLNGLARRVSDDPVRSNDVLQKLVIRMLDAPWNYPPAASTRAMLQVIEREFPGVDLYREEKDRSTLLAQQVLQTLQPVIDERPDRFDTLVRLAIGGNILDYGINDDLDLDFARRSLLAVLEEPLSKDALERLRREIAQARSIVYVLDNCGEAVFDALLIRHLGAERVTLVVRGGPSVNDVTERELESSGLAGIRWVSTGDNAPGVIEEFCSDEFRRVLRSADLVIAKGQGNFETLSDFDRPIAFLFRAKCPVVRELLGNVPQDSLQIQIGKVPFSRS
ncbi:MAG: DUF89 family protein [Victivallales bacterium]|nr:DUF89 family protein [Victivallales bacterium]